MTNQDKTILAALALVVSNEAPERFSRFGIYTYIRRSTLLEIRAALSGAMIDWRAHHRSARERAEVQRRQRGGRP